VREFAGAIRGAGGCNGGVLTAGMVIGLIDDIPTCAELIERMTRDCRAT